MAVGKRSQSSSPKVPALRSRDAALERVLAVAPPPLLLDESRAHFEALAESVVAATQPRDAIEDILIRDVIDLTWEVQRYRRAKAGVIAVARAEGLEKVLAAIGHGNSFDRTLMSRLWAGEVQAKGASEKIHKALFEAGLTLEDAAAKSIELKLDSLERLNRLEASAEARRNKAMREVDRRREALGEALRRAIDQVEDAEFTEVEAGHVSAEADV